jgi:hypothetical protein
MHPTYFSAFASNDADAEELEHPEDEQPAIVEFDGFDEAIGDPPPHAAKPTPRATTAATRPANRQLRRPSLDVRLDLSSVSFVCMSLPFVSPPSGVAGSLWGSCTKRKVTTRSQL